jgi:hypothetical protein
MSTKIERDTNSYRQTLDQVIFFFTDVNRYIFNDFNSIAGFLAYYKTLYNNTFQHLQSDIENLNNTKNPTINDYLLRLIQELKIYNQEWLTRIAFVFSGEYELTEKSYIRRLGGLKKKCQKIRNTARVLLSYVFSRHAISYLNRLTMITDFHSILLTRLIILISAPGDVSFEILARRLITINPAIDYLNTQSIDRLEDAISGLFLNERVISAYNDLNNAFLPGSFNSEDTKCELLDIIKGLKGKLYFLQVNTFNISHNLIWLKT